MSPYKDANKHFSKWSSLTRAITPSKTTSVPDDFTQQVERFMGELEKIRQSLQHAITRTEQPAELTTPASAAECA